MPLLGYKISKIRPSFAAARRRGAEDGASPREAIRMTTALLAISPRISYRALFLVLFVAAYPLWHADFPAVSIEHVDVVPTAPQSTAIPLPDSVAAPSVQSVPGPETRLGQCRG